MKAGTRHARWAEKRQKAQKKRYPFNWRNISARIRYDRAQGRCEWCGKPKDMRVLVGAQGSWADDQGRWFDRFGKPLPGPAPWPPREWWEHVIRTGGEPPQIRGALVVLQTAHLDHNPRNCADDNLAALCQFCHAEYDADQRVWSGEITRDLRRGQRVLWKD